MNSIRPRLKNYLLSVGSVMVNITATKLGEEPS